LFAAEKIGFRSLGVKLSLNKIEEAPLPCILHWNKEHYVILYKGVGSRKYRNSSNLQPKTSSFSDSAIGLIEYTKIGMEGVGMSTGQKQRLLIARAVYKDPEMLFFDETTSALDANNEK